MKVQAESFHLNDHIIGFRPHTKLRVTLLNSINTLAVKRLREYKIYQCLRKTRWTKHFLWDECCFLMWLWLDKNWRWHWLQNSLNYPQITINTSIKSKHHVFKTLKVQGIFDQTNLNNKLIQNSFRLLRLQFETLN